MTMLIGYSFLYYFSKMKKVMTRDTREIIIIDETKEKDWMTKYLHCTGVEFENEAEKSIGDVTKPVLSDEQIQEKLLKQLHKKYRLKFEKEVSARYKNDVEWIQNKLR